ncbi:MAG TPA: type II 3-dehydroquinate dehydratase [Deltaproteobacteria bacterium]|nr:type II 3-dehydroquinate dehydratase [Deltaproteobacteria bacterium]
MKVMMINGPNLNMLGKREPSLYGSTTIETIQARVREKAADLGLEATCFQSNHEGEIVEKIHEAADLGIDGIIINPAAYTHTSVAIRDALLSVQIPFIEVHISNVAAREEFRQVNLFSDIAEGTIAGLGAYGYILALDALRERHDIKNQ